MQRACAAALLHQGITQITNPGISNDDLAALNVIRDLGAVTREGLNDVLIVEPNKSKINSSAVGANTGIILSTISFLISILAIVTR